MRETIESLTNRPQPVCRLTQKSSTKLTDSISVDCVQ